jgi:hypothetical protein
VSSEGGKFFGDTLIDEEEVVITKSGGHNVIGGLDHSILLYSHDPSDPMSNISLGDVSNPIDRAHDDDGGSESAP